MTSSELGATLIQPLWRGAGYKVTMENLTQAERNVLYALRDFTLFRKRFSVDVATAYYGVLQNRDAVRNAYLNLQNSRKNAERTRALASEGRVAQADLGRLEQQELSTESTWIGTVPTHPGLIFTASFSVVTIIWQLAPRARSDSRCSSTSL